MKQNLGSFNCENCQPQSTISDTLNVLVKIAVLGAAAYMAITFRSQIKETVALAITKGQKHLKDKEFNGRKRKN